MLIIILSFKLLTKLYYYAKYNYAKRIRNIRIALLVVKIALIVVANLQFIKTLKYKAFFSLLQ